MGLLARDVMERHVITLSPNDPISNVHRLFVEEGIHGAPVVDETGRLLGVVSSLDLLRSAAEVHDLPEPDPRDLRQILDLGNRSFGLDVEAGGAAEPTVADVMTDGPMVSVRPDAPIPAVARVLRENAVHRAIVVEGRHVCGIISSFDLLRVLEEEDAR
ncbi:MAG: CBS domain-containing protein [Myxococcota bacterium]